MAHLLVVDDDQGMREFLEIMLAKEGFAVTVADSGDKALALCRKNAFDLIVTDIRMPKMDGIEFLRRVKDLNPDLPVVLITGFASAETALSAMK